MLSRYKMSHYYNVFGKILAFRGANGAKSIRINWYGVAYQFALEF